MSAAPEAAEASAEDPSPFQQAAALSPKPALFSEGAIQNLMQPKLDAALKHCWSIAPGEARSRIRFAMDVSLSAEQLTVHNARFDVVFQGAPLSQGFTTCLDQAVAGIHQVTASELGVDGKYDRFMAYSGSYSLESDVPPLPPPAPPVAAGQ